jgi:hypothetical protein
MFDSATYVKCVSFISGKRVKVEAAIAYYKTPWQGDPRVNIQNSKGKAKAYQVNQVLRAIEKFEVNHGFKK